MLNRIRNRLKVLKWVLGLTCLLPLASLVQAQIFDYKFYREWATERRIRESAMIPPRARILDRNGHLLADNVLQYDISASLAYVIDPFETANLIADYLDLDADDLFDMLSRDAEWVLISRRVPKSIGDEIEELGISGIGVAPIQVRSYPEGSLAAHVLGFVNAEGKGYYGIEGHYDDELRGRPGLQIYQSNTAGGVAPAGLEYEEAPQPGADLVLTLDRNAQVLVEEELALALDETGAESGVIIVMDPCTGAILAMAVAPTYDPNSYWTISDEQMFTNYAVSSQYEPGSIFNVLTVAAALDAGLVTPETTYYDHGWIDVGGLIVENASRQSYGEQTVADVLIKSLNVGAAWLSTQMGPWTFYRYVQAFGIGEPTEVDLAGEISGQLLLPDDYGYWHDSNLGTNAFGQGVAVTPLQMISAVAAIANDGMLMRPYVVAEKHHANGQVEYTMPVQAHQAVSPETARLVSEMMAQTVEQGIARAQVPGYRVAGKTGTAQIPIPGGYDRERTIVSFVGFAPVDDPQAIVLVRLDGPTSSPWASETVAPTFARMAQRLFWLLEIPPDDVRMKAASSR